MTIEVWVGVGVIAFIVCAIIEAIANEKIIDADSAGGWMFFAITCIILWPLLILTTLFSKDSGLNKMLFK